MDVKKILKEEIEKIRPNKEDINKINKFSKEFLINLKSSLKKSNIDAEGFIGGSVAKNTVIKTDDEIYDIDIFVRFKEKYKEKNISEILESVLKNDYKRVHGSRDYFHIIKDNLIIEIIPVIKVKNPQKATNVTDLSFFHVKYVLDKIKKDKKLADEIRLAKAFCHSQNCYGAESYIKGFSGYSIELLIIHYKSFLNFLKAIANEKELILIDDLKHYKNKKNILNELNESKLKSPIILIDPTFKDRNALSGLSEETFQKFKKASIEFLKNPNISFFTKKDILAEFEKEKNLKILIIKTNKQKGDIAGTKSKKFHNYLISQIKKEFLVIKSDFKYEEENNVAYSYISIKEKGIETVKGPPIKMTDHFNSFKKSHPEFFIKNNISYAKLKHEIDFEEFIQIFNNKEKKIMNEMGIIELKITN
ncbi:MAG: hypothetical protein WC867_02135 [Candidatus Pacearchaeota archaeon]|jgi:tRNA nucleotidyltransferase (CCA-adding enzyme)